MIHRINFSRVKRFNYCLKPSDQYRTAKPLEQQLRQIDATHPSATPSHQWLDLLVCTLRVYGVENPGSCAYFYCSNICSVAYLGIYLTRFEAVLRNVINYEQFRKSFHKWKDVAFEQTIHPTYSM